MKSLIITFALTSLAAALPQAAIPAGASPPTPPTPPSPISLPLPPTGNSPSALSPPIAPVSPPSGADPVKGLGQIAQSLGFDLSKSVPVPGV